MAIVHDPSLGMTSSKAAESEGEGEGEGEGTIPFMSPELLDPPRFKLKKCTPSKEADIYAMAMVIYQVRTTQCLAHTLTGSSRVGTHWNTTIRRARGSV